MRLATWAKRHGATVVQTPSRKVLVTMPLLTDTAGLFELSDYPSVAYHIDWERWSMKQYGELKNGRLMFWLVRAKTYR